MQEIREIYYCEAEGKTQYADGFILARHFPRLSVDDNPKIPVISPLQSV